LLLHFSTNIRVARSDLSYNGRWGLYVNGGTQAQGSVTDTLLSHNGWDGLYAGFFGYAGFAPSFGLIVTRCVFTANARTGISTYYANLVVVDSTISNNRGGGIWFREYQRLDLSNSVISGNLGGPALTADFGCVVTNNTFVGNTWPTIVQLSWSPQNTYFSSSFTGNNVTANRCKVAVHVMTGLGAFNLNTLVNKNATYEIKYSSAGQVLTMDHCWWGSTSPTFVASRLLHFAADSALGAVVASPFRLSPALNAATAVIPDSISGVISADTTWLLAQSPISLSRNTLVVHGATLTIQAGVTVRVSPAVSLLVDGGLLSLGTAALPVKITAAGGGAWAQLLVSARATAAVFNTSAPGAPYVSGTALWHTTLEFGGFGASGKHLPVIVGHLCPPLTSLVCRRHALFAGPRLSFTRDPASRRQVRSPTCCGFSCRRFDLLQQLPRRRVGCEVSHGMRLLALKLDLV
jgi:hypothetical protein